MLNNNNFVYCLLYWPAGKNKTAFIETVKQAGAVQREANHSIRKENSAMYEKPVRLRWDGRS